MTRDYYGGLSDRCASCGAALRTDVERAMNPETGNSWCIGCAPPSPPPPANQAEKGLHVVWHFNHDYYSVFKGETCIFAWKADEKLRREQAEELVNKVWSAATLAERKACGEIVDEVRKASPAIHVQMALGHVKEQIDSRGGVVNG